MYSHVFAERGERQTRHLEVLPGERYADNRDEQQYAEEYVCQPCPQSTEDYPDDIQGYSDTP